LIGSNNKQRWAAIVRADDVPSASVKGQAAAIGAISEGSLFLTLPTRGLTGQQIISSEG
jgi:hypothetical protein